METTIQEVRRDDPDQTLVTTDLRCRLNENQQTLALEPWIEVPDLQEGDLISCDALPHLVIVDEVNQAATPNGARRTVITYRLPDHVR